MRLTRTGRARHQRGLSIVELMVGFAIGLFIVGGAIKLFVDYLGSNRRLLLETRVNQDLRAAADIIARDLRRAGYWQNAATGIWNSSSSSFLGNPYRNTGTSGEIVLDDHENNSRIQYVYDKDGNGAVDAGEQMGFRIDNGALQMRSGGTWQAVTDPATLTIRMVIDHPTTNSAGVATDTVELWPACPCLTELKCANADFTSGTCTTTRPRAFVSRYTVTLTGTSTTDPAVVRTLSETVRVRNDEVRGFCPSSVSSGICNP
jgi:type IV pilus assembly protein PilW